MIFYFSGTGNSQWVANSLCKDFEGTVLSIGDELKKNKSSYTYKIKEGEKVFFVFPVHSWGPAVLIMRFIDKLKLDFEGDKEVFSIAVCGDDCGMTTEIMQIALKKQNIVLTAGFSIQMPNNYILMQGFDTDSKDVETSKLTKAPDRIKEIKAAIQNKNYNGLYISGKYSFIKSKLIYPLFSHFAIGKNSFYHTDACIGCGLCERVCPTNTIKMVNDRPQWSNTCVQCVACIHRCPARAIEYGKITIKKGRYHNPTIK